jgi:cysteine-rich repeat protein
MHDESRRDVLRSPRVGWWRAPLIPVGWLLLLSCGASAGVRDDDAKGPARGDASSGGMADDATGGVAEAGEPANIGGTFSAGGDAGASSTCGEPAVGGAGGDPGTAPERVCGDGIVTADEACDDANVLSGDGCAGNCRLEIGFGCHGQPSVCMPTVCGNGLREGAETCDDGNQLPLDGCGVTCQREPECSQNGCTSTCGDGLVIAEPCDDGNVLDGDGCSATCQVEPGSTCEQKPDCDGATGPCRFLASAIYRDFSGKHPDFGAICTGPQYGGGESRGLVEPSSREVCLSPRHRARALASHASRTGTPTPGASRSHVIYSCFPMGGVHS